MRVVQEDLDLVQNDAKAGAMRRFDRRTEVLKQLLDFAPVNVGTERVVVDGLQQMQMFVTHAEFLLLKISIEYRASASRDFAILAAMTHGPCAFQILAEY